MSNRSTNEKANASPSAPANFRSIQAVANPETIARKTKGIKGRKSRFHCKRPRFHQNRTGSTTTAMATMAFANNPRQNNNKASAYALQVLVRSDQDLEGVRARFIVVLPRIIGKGHCGHGRRGAAGPILVETRPLAVETRLPAFDSFCFPGNRLRVCHGLDGTKVCWC